MNAPATATQTPAENIESPTAPPAAPANPLATPAMVTGITAAALGIIPFVNMITWIAGIVAIVLGAIALNNTRHGAPRRGRAITGLACGAFGVIIPMLFLAFTIGVLAEDTNYDDSAKSDSTLTTSANKTHKPADDVELSDYSVDESGLGAVDVTITNHTSKASDYIVTVELLDAEGNRVAEGYASASALGAGETKTEEIVGAADGAKVVKVKVAEVERFAS